MSRSPYPSDHDSDGAVDDMEDDDVGGTAPSPVGRAVPAITCTACGRCISSRDELFMHEIISAIICEDCHSTTLECQSAGFVDTDSQDQAAPSAPDVSHDFCTWCGEGGDLFCCSSCPRVFCEACVTRNFGTEHCEGVRQASEWSCIACQPDAMKNLKIAFSTATEYFDTVERDQANDTTTVQTTLSEQELVDRLIAAETELEEAANQLEESPMELQIKIEAEIKARDTNVDFAELQHQVTDELQILFNLWQEKYDALSELVVSLQEQCCASGINIAGIYHAWEPRANQLDYAPSLRNAGRLGRPSLAELPFRESAQRELNETSPLTYARGKLMEKGASGCTGPQHRHTNWYKAETPAEAEMMNIPGAHEVVELDPERSFAVPQTDSNRGVTSELLQIATEAENMSGLSEKQKKSLKVYSDASDQTKKVSPSSVKCERRGAVLDSSDNEAAIRVRRPRQMSSCKEKSASESNDQIQFKEESRDGPDFMAVSRADLAESPRKIVTKSIDSYSPNKLTSQKKLSTKKIAFHSSDDSDADGLSYGQSATFLQKREKTDDLSSFAYPIAPSSRDFQGDSSSEASEEDVEFIEEIDVVDEDTDALTKANFKRLKLNASAKKPKKDVHENLSKGSAGKELKVGLTPCSDSEESLFEVGSSESDFIDDESEASGESDDGEDKLVKSKKSAHKEMSTVLVNVAKKSEEASVYFPKFLHDILKDHQIDGTRFLFQRCIGSVEKVKAGDRGKGCILAHSMGLGKTLQVVSFLHISMNMGLELGLKTALILVPINTLHNWKSEFRKFLGPVAPSIWIIEDNRDRIGILKKWRKFGGVLLMGYGLYMAILSNKATAEEAKPFLVAPGPDIVVLDEAHLIHNPKSKCRILLESIKTVRRVMLTGTPLQNNLKEYYYMIGFVEHGKLSSFQHFVTKFANPIKEGQVANADAESVRLMKQRLFILREKTKDIIQRADASHLRKSIPNKSEYVIVVALSPLQKQLYGDFLEAVKANVEEKCVIV